MQVHFEHFYVKVFRTYNSVPAVYIVSSVFSLPTKGYFNLSI